jgi:hypothetical protein
MKNYRYGEDNKVVDSTKGNADLNPRQYKGDVYTQTWIDARKLATLSIWLDDAGYNTRFLSEVVKFTVNLVLDHLVETKTVEMIEFTEEARNILEAKYRTNLNPGGRGKRNILHNMVLDDRRKEGNVGGYNPDSRFIKEEINIPVQPKDDKPPKQSNQSNQVTNKFDFDKAVKMIDDGIQRDTEEKNKKDMEKALANVTYGEDIGNGERIVIVKPVKGNPDEKDMKEHEEREELRRKAEDIKKEKWRIERRLEKSKNKLDDLEEEENE